MGTARATGGVTARGASRDRVDLNSTLTKKPDLNSTLTKRPTPLRPGEKTTTGTTATSRLAGRTTASNNATLKNVPLDIKKMEAMILNKTEEISCL